MKVQTKMDLPQYSLSAESIFETRESFRTIPGGQIIHSKPCWLVMESAVSALKPNSDLTDILSKWLNLVWNSGNAMVTFLY